MKVLLTGGLGYLGGRLAQYLEQNTRYEVLVGSRRLVQRPPWLSKAVIVKTVWDSQKNLNEICAGVDVIVHLAGMNAHDCSLDPVQALEFNGVATARLLTTAISQKVKRFIYFSTAHVYCNPLRGVISEETVPRSLHPYATSHKAAEEVVLAATLRSELEGIVIRLSNTYGAPADKKVNAWTLLVNDLCLQAVTTHQIILKSPGNQRRDFITMTDVCRATEHLLNLELKNREQTIFNVGGNWSPTILEITELLQSRCLSVLGFRPELIVPFSIDKTTFELIYQTDLLCQAQFKLTSDRVAEIDQLLHFCNLNFSTAYDSVL